MATIWFVKDCSGVVMLFVTYISMIGLSILCYILTIQPLIHAEYSGIIYSFYTQLFLILLSFISQIRCVFTNPGSLNTESHHDLLLSLISENCFSKCMQCSALRPYRTHHCHICNHCILSMDHHCPWVNNCIGHFTAKHFILFLFYALLASILMMVHIALRGLLITNVDKDSLDTFYCTMVGLVTVLYIVFIAFMLRDQWMNIVNNTNAIDEMQGHKFEKVRYM